MTPTEQDAVERHKRFREHIAHKAAELEERKQRIQLAAVPIAAIEAPLISDPNISIIQPESASNNWFVVLSQEQSRRTYPLIRDIQKAVCRYFSLSFSDLISPRRTAMVVRPRQIACYLCKELTLHSLPEIGRRFGGRDHTTILHAVRKIESMLSDADLKFDVDSIKEQIAEAA